MQIIEAEDPEAVCSTPRALVYLIVDWSGPERASRKAFFEAAWSLSMEYPAMGVTFYCVEEEAEAFREFFLARRHRPPQGNGALIWLEAGRRVDSAFSAHWLGAEGIVGRDARALGPTDEVGLTDRDFCVKKHAGKQDVVG